MVQWFFKDWLEEMEGKIKIAEWFENCNRKS